LQRHAVHGHQPVQALVFAIPLGAVERGTVVHALDLLLCDIPQRGAKPLRFHHDDARRVGPVLGSTVRAQTVENFLDRVDHVHAGKNGTKIDLPSGVFLFLFF